MRYVIIPIIYMVLFCGYVSAEVIFEDNFDDHPDWSPTQPAWPTSNNTSQDGGSDTACTGCPQGAAKYAGYRVAMSCFDNSRTGEDTIQIDSQYARSGKAFHMFTEPLVDNGDGEFCNDGLLVKDLGADYDEIYVRYYLKFPNGMPWLDDTEAYPGMKMGHMQHTVDGGSYWDFFKDGDSWPIAVPQFGKDPSAYWDGAGLFRMMIRKQSCYYPSDGYNDMPGDVSNGFFRYGISNDTLNCTLGTDCDTWDTTIMDGGWHHIEYRLKGNSAMGVSDGIWEMYVDDVLIVSKTDIPWADLGQNADGLTSCTDCTGNEVDPPSDFVGWNVVTIGGNMYNGVYAKDSAASVEAPYVIDDYVISTTYIGPDYVIGGDPVSSNSHITNSGQPMMILSSSQPWSVSN